MSDLTLRLLNAEVEYQKEIGLLRAEIESQQATIDELTDENNRLVPESKQCHLRNDELVHEHIALQATITELKKRPQMIDMSSCESRVRELEATITELRNELRLERLPKHVPERCDDNRGDR